MSTHTTQDINELLTRFAAGDAGARERLIERSMERFRVLAQRQLRQFPAVQRWSQTDDVLQGAAIRLHRALESVRPKNSREFFALCSALIRRELIDMKRSLFGPEGMGANHASRARDASNDTHAPRADEQLAHDTTHDPAKLARWTELHARIDTLPAELRDVFDLVWYQDLTHADAAAILGVSTKSISRRWRDARLELQHLLEDGQL